MSSPASSAAPFAAGDAPRLVLVTGGTSGFGFGAVQLLLEKGYEVALTSRDAASAAAAAARAVGSVPGCAPERACGLALDLSDLASVAAFAGAWVARFGRRRLAGLILNAGIAKMSKDVTKQGLEACVGTNHHGHAALVNALAAAGVFAADRPCRVVAVGSIARHSHALVVGTSDLTGVASFGAATYGNSKMLNHVWAHAADARLRGLGLTFTSCHPGSSTFTGLGRTDVSPAVAAVLGAVLTVLFVGPMWLAGQHQTWREGGAAEVAALEEPSSPAYFYRHWRTDVPRDLMNDKAAQDWVWAETQRILADAAAKHGLPATLAMANVAAP